MRLQQRGHQQDWVLYFTVVILLVIGVITVLSASTVLALHAGLSATHFAVRQLAAGVLGIVMMTLLSKIPYLTWSRLSVPAMGLCMALLLLVLIPGIGHSADGGRRWIGTTSIHIQPSELAIVGCVLYLSFFFTKRLPIIENFKRGVRPALFIMAANFILVFLEPDMGTALTLLATCLTILFASGARLKPLLMLVAAFTPVLFGMAFMAKYRVARMTAFLDPFHSGSAAYQLLQGWTAMAAGGWFGKGFGQSIEKTGYMPVPQADFIFPVYVEEWGLVGGIALLVLFAMLVWRGFSIARHAPDRFGALVAVGITCIIAVKTIINLGAVTGIMPVTGVPLPFISYGGTSLVVDLAAMGILLNISRYALTTEPDSDALAPVFDVEIARKQLKPRPAVERPPVASERRRSAPVQPLFGTGSRVRSQSQSRESWRTKQKPTISSEVSDPRRSTMPKSALSTTTSWRARQAADTSLSTRKSQSKRGPFKKGQ